MTNALLLLSQQWLPQQLAIFFCLNWTLLYETEPPQLVFCSCSLTCIYLVSCWRSLQLLLLLRFKFEITSRDHKTRQDRSWQDAARQKAFLLLLSSLLFSLVSWRQQWIVLTIKTQRQLCDCMDTTYQRGQSQCKEAALKIIALFK